MAHEDIAARAADFVIRREAPDWSDADQAELQAWLDASFAHKAAYWRLSRGWKTADRLAALAHQPEMRRSPRWAIPMARLKIAAGIAALLAVGSIGFWAHEPLGEERAAIAYATRVGGRDAIGLADGSRVELNTATRLRSTAAKTNRQVWLDQGEAFFKVVHDPAHPFVVHAGDYRVTVLGTSFAVQRQGEAVTVSVVEGRVRVDRSNGERIQIGRPAPSLVSGQRAILSGADMVVTDSDASRVERALAWRDGMLSFDGAALGDVVADFNRYNDRKIVVADPDVAAIRLTGTFRSANQVGFLRLLREAYGLRVEIAERDVKISG
ncbi:FecR family protein [Sphingomonas floccifaciens]|uniref:FecR family protein n=1 Tax=Sphingomonas floccifaciens TaxID=1844115 RepID=A0ABW4NGH6_9SPHN